MLLVVLLAVFATLKSAVGGAAGAFFCWWVGGWVGAFFRTGFVFVGYFSTCLVIFQYGWCILVYNVFFDIINVFFIYIYIYECILCRVI